jgi:hypothetical protein
MIPDFKEMFSRQQAVTATAGGEYILDLANHGDDVNRLLTLLVQARTPAQAEGAATVTVELYTDSALNSGGDDLAAGTKIWSSDAIGKASLTKGAIVVKTPLPGGIKRYLKLKYVVATGPLTAGTFDAGIYWGVDEQQ